MLEGKLKYAYKYFSYLEYRILFLLIVIVEPLTRIALALITKPTSINKIFKAYILFFKRKNFK